MKSGYEAFKEFWTNRRKHRELLKKTFGAQEKFNAVFEERRKRKKL